MNKSSGLECLAWTWGIAVLVGFFVGTVLWTMFGWTFMQGAFMGVLALLVLGAVLTLMMCRASAPGPVSSGSAGVNGTTAADTSAQDSAAAAAKAKADGDAAAAKAKADADAAQADADAAAAAQAEADAAAAAAQAEADAAARAQADADAAAAQAEADAEAARVAAAAEADAEAARVAAAAEADAEAARVAAAAEADAEAARAAASPAGEDYDGDGVVEGADEGTRPEALDGPRGGVADDLKRIKGIGPKMEKLCNSLGFYHFDQIASWSPDEVAWVNANLEGFKGRVTRDTWVEQAGLLASGAETEFSKKVDDGDVY